MISQHWFRWWLGAVRQQAITWANVDTDPCRHMASLGHNELIRPKCVEGSRTSARRFHLQTWEELLWPHINDIIPSDILYSYNTVGSLLNTVQYHTNCIQHGDDTELDIKHLVYLPIGHVVLKIYVPCKNFDVPSQYLYKPCKAYVYCWKNKYMPRLKNHLPNQAHNHKSLYALGQDLHAPDMQARLMSRFVRQIHNLSQT